MATTPIQTHPLLAVPFNAATDFTVLADHCENFAETLIESNDPTLKLRFAADSMPVCRCCSPRC